MWSKWQMKRTVSRTTLRFEASCRTSTVKRAPRWPGSSPPRPAPRTYLILGHISLVRNKKWQLCHFYAICSTSLRAVWFCFRSRGGSAQKDGVPGVCVSRPLWIFQVTELAVPHYSHQTRKRLHLDPHRTHTSPHSQRVRQWCKLTGLWYGLSLFKQTFVHLCNIMKPKMAVENNHYFTWKFVIWYKENQV